MSIIGTGVTGSLSGKTAAADDESTSSSSSSSEPLPPLSIGQSLAQRLESLVAYSSYSVLSGEAKEQPGDGTFKHTLLIYHSHTHVTGMMFF